MIISNKLLKKASSIKKTPFLLTDLNQVTKNYNHLQKLLPNTQIYYAIKSNNDPNLIKHLAGLKSKFDVASLQEIKLAIKSGSKPKNISFSAPIKKVDEISKAYKIGIRQYTFDSVEELYKLHHHAPKSLATLRIHVDSQESQCPMHKKFGVDHKDALKYLIMAKGLGLKPIGITFHVGSQCLNSQNWKSALDKARMVWQKAREYKINLELVNLGGGLPSSYSTKPTHIETHTDTIETSLRTGFLGLNNTYIEPGRFMTNNASIMVSTVIGTARRGDQSWIYLDVGGFNGLFEIFEKFKYQIVPLKKPTEEMLTYAVGGPTCDGMDIIRESIQMPKVSSGDRVCIINAGAYSTSMQTYNGMEWAKSYTYD